MSTKSYIVVVFTISSYNMLGNEEAIDFSNSKQHRRDNKAKAVNQR